MSSTRSSHVLVLALMALTWGSSFILMKRALHDIEGNVIFSPDQVASLRLVVAGLALLPISIPAFRKIPRKDLKWVLLVGLLGSGIPAFLFTHAQMNIDSALAGILNSLTPLFTLLIGIFIFHRTTHSRQVVGVLMGLVGAVALISLKGIGNSNNWWFSGLIIIATACYGMSVNVVQSKLMHIKAIHLTAVAQLTIFIPALIIMFSTGVPGVVENNPEGLRAMGYVAILGLGGTAFANILYFWLTQKTNALFASSVTYLIPIVAVGWGLADKEHLTVFHLLCGGVILSGVYLVTYRKKLLETTEKGGPAEKGV